jgi:hypothetical protein
MDYGSLQKKSNSNKVAFTNKILFSIVLNDCQEHSIAVVSFLYDAKNLNPLFYFFPILNKRATYSYKAEESVACSNNAVSVVRSLIVIS